MNLPYIIALIGVIGLYFLSKRISKNNKKLAGLIVAVPILLGMFVILGVVPAYNYSQGKEAIRNGENQKAITYLRKVADKSSDASLLLAQAYFLVNDYENTVKYCNKAIEFDHWREFSKEYALKILNDVKKIQKNNN